MFFYCFSIIIALCKFLRIILQIGEFYFSIILFGIFLETTTLLITSSSKFMTLEYFLLEILLLLSIFFFTNIMSLLPLTLQFWEAANLRYIKEKNPFKVIIRENSSENDIDEINYKYEIFMDSFCLVAFILYIVSLIVYNKCPIMFEVLNSISFVFYQL